VRIGEILRLKWEHLLNGFIYLGETKAKGPKQIPLNDDLYEMFKQIRKKQHLTSKYGFTYKDKPN
jgi:integrase